MCPSLFNDKFPIFSNIRPLRRGPKSILRLKAIAHTANTQPVVSLQCRPLSSLLGRGIYGTNSSVLLSNPKIHQIGNNIITRNVTKYSWGKGRRKSVKSILRRFYRLRWGAWIRTKCGRHKKLWKKSPQRKRRLRQHVFCNAQQSMLLDKMAGSYWRKPKYYVGDPYEPYHSREEYHTTYVKPRPYFPNE